MQKIINLSAIDSNSDEGKYLIAALVKLTENIPGDKNVPEAVEETLEQLTSIVERTHRGSETWDDQPGKPLTFLEELRSVINRHSIENVSDTPDFVLADLLLDTINNYSAAVRKRDKFFGFDPNKSFSTII